LPILSEAARRGRILARKFHNPIEKGSPFVA
jgi:hypothetical protein